MVLVTCLVLGLVVSPVRGAVVGSTYYFRATWYDSEFRLDSGDTFKSTTTGEFKVHVFNATKVSGHDVYQYNYNGFHYVTGAVAMNANDTVQFQDNKVFFSLNTADQDHDNKSESSSLVIYPATSSAHPGRNLFVNPVWTTHTTDWNTAVNQAQDNPAVKSLTQAAGDGDFSLTIEVNIEGTVPVGSHVEPANGTGTHSFSAAYDDDGILLSWSYSYTVRLTSENHTAYTKLAGSVVRTSGVGAGPVTDASLASAATYLGLGAIAGLVIGGYVGKKYA
ncbi:MAG: hypothetical protein HXY34_06540 [Candidatus Thorarchaeota archaeon]|nr:hypothetical protein [Candidatus Thorarchaeota archaeon]